MVQPRRWSEPAAPAFHGVQIPQRVAALWEGAAFSVNDYKIDFENALGQGAAASIYHASRCNDAATVAEDARPQELVFKVIDLAADESSAAQEMKVLKNEVSILAHLQGHPNIVGFYGACVVSVSPDVQPQWAIQMEYCAGGDLARAVSRGRFPESQAHSIMEGALGALAHMHSCAVVHRDVKPENVLLLNNQGNTVKITDFGISARLTDSKAMEKRCGSPGYVAPEVWLGDKYDDKVDSFGAGALLYFIISGRGAFSGSCIKSVMVKTLHAPVEFRKSVCLERLSDGCKDFMKTLLEKQPCRRPTACKALAEIWRLTADIDTMDRRVSEDTRPSFRSGRGSSKRSVLSSGRNSYVEGHEPILARSELDDFSDLDELQPEKPRNPMVAVGSIRGWSQRTTNPPSDSEETRLSFRSRRGSSKHSVLSSGRNSHFEGHEAVLARSDLDDSSTLELQPEKPRKPMPGVRSIQACSRRTTNPQSDSEDVRVGFCSEREPSKRSVLTSARNSHVEGHAQILARSSLEEISDLHEIQPAKPRDPMPVRSSPANRRNIRPQTLRGC